MTTEPTPAEPLSSCGNAAMVCGCLLGLVSGVALATGGNMCESILEVLLFRPSAAYTGPNLLADLGTRLLRLSWAPLGVAAGTALTLWGLQQATHRSGRSRVANLLLLVTAIIAGLAAFEMKNSVRQTQTVMLEGSHAQPDDDSEAFLNWSVPAATRGWLLLAIAQATLTTAAIAQTRSRTESSPLSPNRSKEDLAVIVLVGVFGMIVSWSWFTNGAAIERTRNQEAIKASEIVGQLNHVLSSTDWGAWALMASMTVLAITAGFGSSRPVSNSVSGSPS